jgi:hypothetical protein
MKHLLASLALFIAIGTHGTALGDDVTLTLDVTKLPGKCVQLSGKTNLPRGTELTLRVEEKMEGGFLGQSKGVVADEGTFTSEAFGPNNGLQDGRYIAEVMMPPLVQPPSVQAIIGENGQNLTGALVKKAWRSGVIVSRQAEFVIGAEPDAAQKARKKETDSATAELKKKLCIYLEQLLEFKDDANFKQVGFATGGPYNEWMKSVEALRDAQPTGLHPIPLLLRAAPGDLLMVGMVYMHNGETDYTRQMVPELKDIIDYADYRRKGDRRKGDRSN